MEGQRTVDCFKALSYSNKACVQLTLVSQTSRLKICVGTKGRSVAIGLSLQHVNTYLQQYIYTTTGSFNRPQISYHYDTVLYNLWLVIEPL